MLLPCFFIAQKLRSLLSHLVRNQTLFTPSCIQSALPRLDMSMQTPGKMRDVYSGEDVGLELRLLFEL